MNRVKVKQTITYTIRDKDGNIKKTGTKEIETYIPEDEAQKLKNTGK